MNRLAQTVVASTIALASAAFATAAHAAYPDRPVRIIVPYSPGGPADLLARFLAQKLTLSMHQTFVIDNKPGASLTIGATAAANAPADGYTLFVAASSMLLESKASSRKPEANLKDFSAISLIGSVPLLVVVNQDFPVQDVKGLLAYARQHPGEVNYGSSGNGSLTNLAGELFNAMGDVKLVHIPYKGINEAISDLMAGRVQVSFAGAPTALPMVQEKKLRAIAVTSIARSTSAPDLPTVSEAALKGYDVTPWYGLVAPAATPMPIINQLHAEVARIMQMPEVKARWMQWGAEPNYSKSPQELTNLMKSEAAKWSKLKAEGKLKMD